MKVVIELDEKEIKEAIAAAVGLVLLKRGHVVTGKIKVALSYDGGYPGDPRDTGDGVSARVTAAVEPRGAEHEAK